MAAVLLRAYSLGAGTYTGIEAVSNGLPIMREPKVRTGKRTMAYMAVSLAFTAGVLLISYPLIGIRPVEGMTLNAVLADALFGDWPLGQISALITIFSEGALLLMAAQAGFTVRESLEKYCDLARKLGFPADYRMGVSTDVVEGVESISKELAGEFKRIMVFTGQLTFRLEKFYHRILHNETAFAIQRRLQWSGITTIILPIRVQA